MKRPNKYHVTLTECLFSGIEEPENRFCNVAAMLYNAEDVAVISRGTLSVLNMIFVVGSHGSMLTIGFHLWLFRTMVG